MTEFENKELDDFDWSLTTWEGSRREQLRRWAALPLENMVKALEDMEEFSRHFAQHRARPARSKD